MYYQWNSTIPLSIHSSSNSLYCNVNPLRRCISEKACLPPNPTIGVVVPRAIVVLCGLVVGASSVRFSHGFPTLSGLKKKQKANRTNKQITRCLLLSFIYDVYSVKRSTIQTFVDLSYT